jgi:hypothetical protein
MGKVSKKNTINENTKKLATMLVDGILNKDRKSADKALSEMVNNRISAKIKKVAQTEDLI